MITTNLTFYINIYESKTSFIQSVAEILMCYRGFGCTEYYFDDRDPKKAFEIDLTLWYNDFYRKFYREENE